MDLCPIQQVGREGEFVMDEGSVVTISPPKETLLQRKERESREEPACDCDDDDDMIP